MHTSFTNVNLMRIIFLGILPILNKACSIWWDFLVRYSIHHFRQIRRIPRVHPSMAFIPLAFWMTKEKIQRIVECGWIKEYTSSSWGQNKELHWFHNSCREKQSTRIACSCFLWELLRNSNANSMSSFSMQGTVLQSSTHKPNLMNNNNYNRD